MFNYPEPSLLTFTQPPCCETHHPMMIFLAGGCGGGGVDLIDFILYK